MILADYPGHLAAGALLGAAAALLVAAYRLRVVAAAGRRRWLLALLRYAAVAALLVLIWNPSRPASSELSRRNTVLAVFDTSESMSVRDGGESSRLDRAVEMFKARFRPEDPEGPLYRLFGFDAQSYAADSADGLKRWGPRTNVHTVLSLFNRYDLATPPPGPSPQQPLEGSKVVGAVVFTDGQADSKNVQSYLPLRSPGFKLFFVGIGSESVQRDVAISSIRCPATVALGTPYDVEVEVSAKGIADQVVNVVLLEDSVPADIKSVRVQKDDDRAALRFNLGARVLGRHRLTARVVLSGEEANTANNERDGIMEVIEAADMRVLLYSQVANFDFGKIRSCLERDEKILLDIGLDAVIAPGLGPAVRAGSGHVPLPEDAEGFFAYDVIILGPCDMDNFSEAQKDGLYRFVSERGGGLVLLPGRDEWNLSGHSDPRIRTLLPAELPIGRSGGPGRPGKLELTREGLKSALVSDEALEGTPVTPAAYHAGAAAKPAALVLATAAESPIVCSHRVGRGAVCLINTYGLFKWYREDLEGGLLAEFLSGLTAGLGRIRSLAAHLELFAARAAGDPYEVEFEARVFDQGWGGVEGATVLLEAAGQTLRMEESGKGRYVAVLRDFRDENVVARVQAEKGAVFIGERMLAAALPAPKGEMDRIELDGAFLEKLAERLGGEYLDAAPERGTDWKGTGLFEAASLSYDTAMTSAWRRWPLLVALCVLLSAEWFIRRAMGLI